MPAATTTLIQRHSHDILSVEEALEQQFDCSWIRRWYYVKIQLWFNIKIYIV